MKIAVNLLPFRKQLAGAGRYAKNIMKHLALIDKENEYVLFVTDENKAHFETENNNFRFEVCPFQSKRIYYRIFYEQFVFPFRLRKVHADILFTPSVAVPLLYSGSMFTTIHDVVYMRMKKKYPFLRKHYVSFITSQAARKSDVVVTVSEFSKKEIQELLHTGNKKIVVTYNGVDDSFYSPVEEESKSELRQKYGLPEKFLLYVGAIEPGKNLDTLITVFEELIKDGEDDVKLVMTGGVGWRKETILDLLGEKGLIDRSVILPYIPDAELPVLYSTASVFVYISSYEGFGIPVLEAMASGTPVVASNSPSISEFAGEAVLLQQPMDVMGIKYAVKSLLNDADKRKLYIEKGKQRAEQYNWFTSAETLLKSFKEFLIW